ncbi:MAG: MBL fold metallo-hydrolase [Pseudomonadota bacterium]
MRALWSPTSWLPATKLALLFAVIAALGLTTGCSKMTVLPTDLSDPVRLPRLADAPPDARAIEVTFFGNSTLLFSDGKTSLMVDGYLSRPNLFEVVLTRLSPNPKIIKKHLRKASISRLDAVVVAHSHYDHVMDAATVAKLTKATLVGTVDTCRVAEAQARVPDSGFEFGDCERLVSEARPEASPPGAVPFELLRDDRVWARGDFKLTAYHSAHGKYGWECLDNALKGNVTEAFTAPAHALSFKEGISYTLHIEHPIASFIVQTSAGLSLDARLTKPADFVFLTTALVDKMSAEDRNAYWDTFVTQRKRQKSPIHVIPIHWDSLFEKLDQKLEPLPDWITDQSNTKAYLEGRANADDETSLIWMDAYSRLRVERE